MLTGIAVFYFVFGVFISFYRKGKHVITYILFLNVYSAWLTDFIFHLEPGDESLFDGMSKYYTYYCFVLFFFIRKKTGCDYSLLYALGFTSLYFICIYTLRGLSPLVGLKFAISVFGSVLLLFVLIFVRASRNQIRYLVKWNLALQLVIGGFQFLGLLHFYMNIGETFVGTSLITGSFTRNNFYAEVISLLLILQCILDYREMGKLTSLSKVFILLVLVMVFATGVRTALVADLIILFLLLFVYGRGNSVFKFKLLIGMLVVGVSLFFVYKIANQGVFIQDNQADNPIERQLNGVREISDRDNMEMSTIVLTFILWEYYIQSPLFGPGLFFASPNGYGGIVAQETANSTDATILFYMCETGLIGVLFFILIYWLALKKYNKHKGPYIVFAYIMIISITDAGFMGYAYMMYFYLSLYYENFEKYSLSNSLRYKKEFVSNV